VADVHMGQGGMVAQGSAPTRVHMTRGVRYGEARNARRVGSRLQGGMEGAVVVEDQDQAKGVLPVGARTLPESTRTCAPPGQQLPHRWSSMTNQVSVPLQPARSDPPEKPIRGRVTPVVHACDLNGVGCACVGGGGGGRGRWILGRDGRSPSKLSWT
jgi:hypothetical protein